MSTDSQTFPKKIVLSFLVFPLTMALCILFFFLFFFFYFFFNESSLLFELNFIVAQNCWLIAFCRLLNSHRLWSCVRIKFSMKFLINSFAIISFISGIKFYFPPLICKVIKCESVRFSSVFSTVIVCMIDAFAMPRFFIKCNTMSVQKTCKPSPHFRLIYLTPPPLLLIMIMIRVSISISVNSF